MDLLRCIVLILAAGACRGFFQSTHNGFEDSSRVDRALQVNRKIYENITKIIGGQPVTEPIPYQVSLQLLVHIKWKHFCGGSIIGNSHVLTAAHCVDRLRPERMFVIVGTNTWKSGGTKHRVTSYVKHPQYDNKRFLINDVAVIKVSTPFKLNQRTIAAISLAESFGSHLEKNYPVSLTGWGSISPTNKAATPDNLMILQYNTITNNECRKKGYQVTSNEICTFFGMNKGACVGDSGGPLVNRERNIQIGIVSYGSTTCASGYPDVYSRVPNFLPWIRRVVQIEMP